MRRGRNGSQYRRDVSTATKHYRLAAAWTNSPECEALDDEHARVEAKWMAEYCGCELCLALAKRLLPPPVKKPVVDELERQHGEIPQPEDDQPLHEQERDERS